MSADPKSSVDFFISYTHPDKATAEWIAWQLEAADYTVIIQAWDFVPGNNFAIEMDSAAKRAKRTIPLLSPAFFESDFTTPEWAQAFANDPTGSKRQVVPVRIQECEVEGLLGPIVYIDLVGLTSDQAIDALLRGVQTGRAKPETEPPAPDFLQNATTKSVLNDLTPSVAGTAPTGLDWRPLAGLSPDFVWRDVLNRGWGTSHRSMVEVQFVPVTTTLVSVSGLNSLPDLLAGALRSSGVVASTSAISANSSADLAFAAEGDGNQPVGPGMFLTRQGQRGVWLDLPGDIMGSVLDPGHTAVRLAAAIEGLFGVAAEAIADRYYVVVRVAPTTMLMVGDDSIVGHRNSAQLRSTADHVATEIEDSVVGAAIASGGKELADELIARLTSRLR